MTAPRQYIPVSALPANVKSEVLQYCNSSEATFLNDSGELSGLRDASGKPIRIMAVQVVNSPSKNSGNGHPQLLAGSSQSVIYSPQLQQNQNFTTVRPVSQVAYASAVRPAPALKRPADDRMDHEYAYAENKRRKEKGSKGLRHFSMKVCEKVQRKGTTSYNEVADELVAEFTATQPSYADQSYDQKNIRRRVYDALNVLMAMNIISKERKEIKWIGLPTNSAQECQNLELEKQRRLDRVKHKTQQLQELILQQIAFKNLVDRNREREEHQGPPASSSAIQLPFIVVNTNKKTVIDCSISSNKYEYLFNFDNTFEIHDDIEVLKRMGMAFGLEKGECSEENLQKATKLVPTVLASYVQDMAHSRSTQAAEALVGPSTSTAPPPATLGYVTDSTTYFKEEEEEEEDEAGSRAVSRQSSMSLSNHMSPEDDEEDSRDMMESDSDDSNIDV